MRHRTHAPWLATACEDEERPRESFQCRREASRLTGARRTREEGRARGRRMASPPATSAAAWRPIPSGLGTVATSARGRPGPWSSTTGLLIGLPCIESQPQVVDRTDSRHLGVDGKSNTVHPVGIGNTVHSCEAVILAWRRPAAMATGRRARRGRGKWWKSNA